MAICYEAGRMLTVEGTVRKDHGEDRKVLVCNFPSAPSYAKLSYFHRLRPAATPHEPKKPSVDLTR